MYETDKMHNYKGYTYVNKITNCVNKAKKHQKNDMKQDSIWEKV